MCRPKSSRHIPCAVHLESLQKHDCERHGGACPHLLLAASIGRCHQLSFRALAFARDFGPGIFERHNSVKDRYAWHRIFDVSAKISVAFELHSGTGRLFCKLEFNSGSHDSNTIRIDIIQERFPLRCLVWGLADKQSIVKSNFDFG